MKKYSHIKEMKTTELSDKLVEEKAMLVKMKLNHGISPLENPLQLREKRKLVARLATELNKRK